jgi:hypothetical protein
LGYVRDLPHCIFFLNVYRAFLTDLNVYLTGLVAFNGCLTGLLQYIFFRFLNLYASTTLLVHWFMLVFCISTDFLFACCCCSCLPVRVVAVCTFGVLQSRLELRHSWWSGCCLLLSSLHVVYCCLIRLCRVGVVRLQLGLLVLLNWVVICCLFLFAWLTGSCLLFASPVISYLRVDVVLACLFVLLQFVRLGFCNRDWNCVIPGGVVVACFFLRCMLFIVV